MLGDSSGAKNPEMTFGFRKLASFVITSLALTLFLASPEILASTSGITHPGEDGAAASSLGKSLLFPGWGQLAEKKYAEGILFLAAETFCLVEVFSLNHKGNAHYNKYREAERAADAEAFRDLTVKYDKKRNAYILAAAGVWVLNLIDIYLIVKNKKNPRIKARIQSGQDQRATVSISYSF